MTKNSYLILTKPKHSLWTESRTHPANETHEVAASKPFEILLTVMSAGVKQFFNELMTGYATRGPVTHLAATGILATGICKSLL